MNSAELGKFGVEPQRQRGLTKLIDTSHRRPMNLADVLPWENTIDKSVAPKEPTHCWLYGTSFYDNFSEQQKSELLWLQTARDVSMFITLEQTLPVLYMGYINKYGSEIPKDITEYLMIFSKEEIVHTMMFKRYLKKAELPMYSGDAAIKNLLGRLPDMPPIMGVLYTLILEWVAELGALYSTQGDNIEPLTKKMFYEHHVDEARHISFGKWLCESHIKNASAEQRKAIIEMVSPMIKRLLPAFSYNPEIARYTSFDFPISPDDKEVHEAIRNSQSNQALNEKRFAPLTRWIVEQGLYED